MTSFSSASAGFVGNVDARNSVWNSISGDQVEYNTTIQVINGVTESDVLRKASASGAAFNSGEREPAPKCLPGTRMDILAALLGWTQRNDLHRICWVNGPAGFGKSAVAQSVAETCAAESTLAASFFFSKRHAERRSSKHLFPTIALHLASSIPQAKFAIYKAIAENPLLPDEILRNQFQKLIIEPLTEVDESFTSRLVIVIDALDECDDETLAGEVVTLFTRALNDGRLRLRLLITSRPELHIESKMTDPDISTSVNIFRLQDFGADADICIFLRESFSKIYSKSRGFMTDVTLPWPSDSTIDAVVQQASGLFICASTVVKFVDSRHNRPDRQLERILEVGGQSDVNSRLDALYLDIITASGGHSDNHHRLILGAVVVMFDPLPIRDLASLLAKPLGELQICLHALQSVLSVPNDDNDPVRIYHASFRDFLVDPQRSLKDVIDQPSCHGTIAQFCLQLMTKELRRNICGISDPSKLNSEIPGLREMSNQSISGAIQYACRFWASHLSKAAFNDALLMDLRSFASKSLLYWFEVLSLLQRFDENTISAVQMTSLWLKRSPKPPADLVELFYDAERFILEFFDPISISALHIYHSALHFVPSSTQLRRLYTHELAGVLTISTGLNESWGACLRVIGTASPVRSLSFSPDKAYIASVTDADGVQLRKTATGILFTTLGGSNLSCSVLFSADGKRVVVGGKDGSVYMWDVATGLTLITEKKHEQAVTTVSFSPDSTCLASAAEKDIYLWDVHTGHFLSAFSGHVDEVTVLEFSPDSSRLASASKDSTIRIWDRTSCLLTLNEHGGVVNSIAFAPSGIHIASGSVDKTVRIWDASTGKCIATSHAHNKGVIVVKFASDGSSVVSVSEDETIKLFTVADRKTTTLWFLGQFIQKATSSAPFWPFRAVSLLPQNLLAGVFGHTIDAIGFSPFTVPLALAAGDHTFILHELKPTNDPPFLGRGLESSALAFSLDSAYLASGSPVKDISICDPNLTDETWEKVHLRFRRAHIVGASPDCTHFVMSTHGEMSLVDAHGSLVCRLLPALKAMGQAAVFSPDSQSIAVPSTLDASLHLFDARSGAALGEIATSRRGIFYPEITCLEFSPDGNHIVVGRDNHTIQVRNIVTGQRVAQLAKAAKGDIKCLKFSPDGVQIAFGDSTGAVKSWEWSTNNIYENPNPHQAAVTSVVFTPHGTCIVSGSSEGTLRAWIPGSDIAPWETCCTPIMSLEFHMSSNGLHLFCRSKSHAVEIWDFETDESDGQGDPAMPSRSWRTDDGCILACQPQFESKFTLRDNGWLFNDDSRICWIPKDYRPRDNLFFTNGNTLICTTSRELLLVIEFSTPGRA